MSVKLHIKKGDTVIVNAGESKGQQGKVLQILVDDERAIVEGVNMISKHTKPNAKNPQGGIVKQEAPIHISNLQPIDPKSGKATRVGRKADAEGKLVRYAKKSCAAMLGFLGTRLGLSIRATGDNAAMVRASSINPAFTITVGLCVSGALCALSGGLLAQYQKSCDINVGTGMVTIALASLIIGETLVGKRTMLRRILGVVFGSCLYRFIVAVALRFNVPAAAMKLVSAIIVAVAISMPSIREHFAFEKRRHAARARRTVTNREGQ